MKALEPNTKRIRLTVHHGGHPVGTELVRASGVADTLIAMGWAVLVTDQTPAVPDALVKPTKALKHK